ncbi:MAG: deoxyguanosinetriphosphate triphosphohydrolase [Lachnospiraceae bacterium]|nr:deoxyguanosinetriphosphate triphosphohydrolase [Lachnospiraceae bacterium]
MTNHDTSIRERLEQREKEYLSPYASLSCESRGRERPEEPCDIRPVYQRDRDRILHCKSFRRLKDKTQVFLTPNGDHYRTRLTHTLEVSQIARTIAKALRMNEDLTEAIALGHDLGHTPFGHAGERALNRVSPYGFVHSEQSVRVVEKLEKEGQGLNLSFEVRDGIRHHQTAGTPSTLEGKIVRLSDKIAYIHHDMDDAVRAGVLKESDIPVEIRRVLGDMGSTRLDRMVHDIISASEGQPEIMMSPEIETNMMALRAFMYREVYVNPVVKADEIKAEKMIEALYVYYLEHMQELPGYILNAYLEGEPKEVVVCDYIANMSDKFAITTFQKLYIPRSWQG